MKKVKKKDLTSEASQIDVVTLAVYLLGGSERAVDTEDVALKAHEIAPGRFSWRKYPQQINLELVRVYLSAAKHPDRGALLSGSGRTGWTLTPAGLRWARESAQALPEVDLSASRAQSRAGSIDENRWRRERERLLATPAWGRWERGARDISAREASEVFRLDIYSTGRLRHRKINRLVSLFGGDKDIAPFIDHIALMIQRDLEDS